MLIEIEYVRAEPPAGEIEGGPGACARFEKEVGDRDAGKFAALVGRLPRKTPVAFGPVEDPGEYVAGQPLESDEVA
jgi:hypothetical protein